MTPAAATQAGRVSAGEQCVLCGVRLTTPYLIARGLCGSCSSRPEAKQLPRDDTGRAVPPTAAAAAPVAGRPTFGPAAKSLIKQMHAYLPAAELLRILNDRLVADVGPQAVRFTLKELHAEVQRIATPAETGDWPALRQVIAGARANGVLAAITMQTVEDFAVVFGLSPAQLLHLKDVVTHAKELS